jgi:hypothetical protein
MNFFLFLVCLYGFILSRKLVTIESIEIARVKNNMLRIYVSAYPRKLRKVVFIKLHELIYRYREKINLFLFDANAIYYSLSDDDRTIIETVISLSY